jgi:hypothetical protein
MALMNACRRSVRALSLCYHNNKGSQTTIDETVEQTLAVCYVAEPNYTKKHAAKSRETIPLTQIIYFRI